MWKIPGSILVRDLGVEVVEADQREFGGQAHRLVAAVETALRLARAQDRDDLLLASLGHE